MIIDEKVRELERNYTMYMYAVHSNSSKKRQLKRLLKNLRDDCNDVLTDHPRADLDLLRRVEVVKANAQHLLEQL